MRYRTALALLAVMYVVVFSIRVASDTDIATCFTPEEDCAAFITERIDSTTTGEEVLVQAYGFTHVGILGALTKAKKRGVEVSVILDESNESARYTGATFMKNNGIPVFIDYLPAIAHSKVIIIDDRMVITGSFNFTKAAAARNVENVVAISDDPTTTSRYRENWHSRKKKSRAYTR